MNLYMDAYIHVYVYKSTEYICVYERIYMVHAKFLGRAKLLRSSKEGATCSTH
jgi:hypothetical protein